MSARDARSVVVLGTMSTMPVPGVVWQTVHYLVGLRRLGYDTLYVEAHARTPSIFVRADDPAGTRGACRFLRDALEPFGFGDRWAFHALHDDGRCHGMKAGAVADAYASAELLLNLCGGTKPTDEHLATDRLVLVCTDPVQIEVELWKGRAETRAFLDAHMAALTFGEAYGRPGCGLPVSPDYAPIPTRQPVVLDFGEHDHADGGRYTTVANWHQPHRPLTYRGETYHWSKDREFERFLDLPARTGLELELALASFRDVDRRRLEAHGWHVREAAALGDGPEPYRTYVQSSRGEFTVAKDQNVRLRSGWFSDRSATYLAAGRPVVTQDTGFGETLPTGKGLFAVSDVGGAQAALETIEADYPTARAAAREVARGWLDHRVVLTAMLADLGVEGPRRRLALRAATRNHASAPTRPAFPDDLVLAPVSRRPLRLPEETVRAVLTRPLPAPARHRSTSNDSRSVSVVVVTYGKLHLTRLCLETLLRHTFHPGLEVVVVDNASEDDTPDYLRRLAAAHADVRLVLNARNEGFAAACNQGARAARGDVLVLLNNDVALAPRWLAGLLEPLRDPTVGAVNPVTNRIGTPAQVAVDWDGTYGGFLRAAARRQEEHGGRVRPTTMLALFCLALRRDTWNRVGELDEGYGTGLFEDDDYSLRLLDAGLRLGCAEGVLVHHFGEASFGDLVPDGTYGTLYERNRARFQRKWNIDWRPSGPAHDPAYEGLVDRVRSEVGRLLPPGASVAVVSRGDESLLRLGGAVACHFPAGDDGAFAGHYPADDGEAVRRLEEARRAGAQYLLVPRPGFWWLEHYRGLETYLESTGRLVARDEDLVLYRLPEGASNLEGAGAPPPVATESLR